MSLDKLKKLVKKEKKDKSLVEAIDKFLYKNANKESLYKAKPSFRPSDVGSKCPRKVFYRYFRVERDFPWQAKAIRIFNMGDGVHELLYEWLKNMGHIIDYRNKGNGEIPKSRHTGKPDPEFPIHSKELGIAKGKIDGVGIFDGKLWIYEFKSTNTKKFEQLEEVIPEHKTQATLYLHVFEELLNSGEYHHIPELHGHTEVAGVRYIYFDKNTSDLKEFISKKDDAEFQAIKEKLENINNYIDKKELPPIVKDNCYWCEFRLKCKKDYNPLK